jgi:methanogenic corrinoid protein MtbC1
MDMPLENSGIIRKDPDLSPEIHWIEQSVADPLRASYMAEILSGRRKIAMELILDAFHSGLPIPGMYVDIFQEALYEVGRLWETNQITVADEHMATAITQYIMSVLYQYLDSEDEKKGTVLMAGVEGELHQVGANMVSDVLESDGWDVIFLGTNVPPDGVIRSIGRHRPDVVGISATMFFNLPAVMRLVDRIREEYGDCPPDILLGGNAFRMMSEPPESLSGYPLAADLRQAIRWMRKQTEVKGKRIRKLD